MAGGLEIAGVLAMSLHSSLRTGGALVQKRSVLTRAERVAKLLAQKKMTQDEKKALGLPKVRV
jgi:small basic protein (TIGR04137 family)